MATERRECGCPVDAYHLEDGSCGLGLDQAKIRNKRYDRRQLTAEKDGRWLNSDDIKEWLAAHDVDMGNTRSVELCREGIYRDNGPEAKVYLRVESYVKDSQGRRFVDWSLTPPRIVRHDDGDHKQFEAAYEVRWIPLRSLPGEAT